ncbi:hypothetical protein quinque_005738 [Culex quinquefasciatus]
MSILYNSCTFAKATNCCSETTPTIISNYSPYATAQRIGGFLPPLPKKRKKDKETGWDIKQHSTGSARMQSFYNIDPREKSQIQVPPSARVFRGKPDRRLLTMFGASTESELLKFNQVKFHKKQLMFAKSSNQD